MHFSDIKLPGSLIAGLYKKSLVELPSYAEATAGEALPEEQKQGFTGNQTAYAEATAGEALAEKQPEPVAVPVESPISAESPAGLQPPGVIAAEIQTPLLLAALPEEIPPPATEPPKPAVVPEQISFLGKNQRNVLILVSYPGETHLPGKQLLFLTRVLQACRLEEKDIAIVNLFKQPLSYASLQEALQPAIILFFGVTPSSIHLQDLNSIFAPEQKEGITMTAYPALEQMQEDNLLKSKLWLTLKQIFNV